MSVVIVIVFIAAIIGIAVWQGKRQKAESWNGVVVDKKTRTETDSDGDFVGTSYFLHVKLDDTDKVKRVKVKKEQWDATDVHDHLVKTAGERYPAKAEA